MPASPPEAGMALCGKDRFFQGQGGVQNLLIVAETRAERAVCFNRLKLATSARENFSPACQARPGSALNCSATDLYFRDMTNKILHAKEYQWRLDDDPKIIAISNEPKR